MAAPRGKAQKASPLFEKMNLERLKHCAETAESSKRAINTSKKLMGEAQSLVEQVHKKRREAS